MSKIDELVAELCSDGVSFFELGNLTSIKTGQAINKIAIQNSPGEYPVINSGRDPLGFFSEYNTENDPLGVTSRGAGVGSITWYPGRYYRGNLNYSVTVIDLNKIDNRFLYHLLLNMQNEIQNLATYDGIPALNASNLKKLKIPIPPLEVQREIVRILDSFTELEAEIGAELEARRRQYKHYSALFIDGVKDGPKYLIEEICHVEKGKAPILKSTPGEYPMVVTTTKRKTCDTYQFDARAVCIPLVSSRGHGVASLNHVYYQEGKFALGTILCALIPKNEDQILPKYLYYYFEQTKDYTLVPLMKGGANVALHVSDIKRLKVPIPSLGEQKCIVDILDQFDKITTDISEGLPAELAARRKQYEYYRNKLLTFEELEA